MSWWYTHVFRPLLFQLPSEVAHDLTLAILGRLATHPACLGILREIHTGLNHPVHCMGLEFPNAIGLAAGMDKRAVALPLWEALGFGFCEMGGITRHPQPGNDKPRMFRLTEHEALINRMGFNNPGAKAMAHRLQQWRDSGLWPAHPVGMNLGKSKITPLEDAPNDYYESARLLAPFVDFFVVNVSSPNTPQLRELQHGKALADVLEATREGASKGTSGHQPPPVLIKIAPDLEDEDIRQLVDTVIHQGVAGIVATNTTLARPHPPMNPQSSKLCQESGGLSGQPLRERSTEVIRLIRKAAGPDLTIIGVGGISRPEHVREKLEAGAQLVQIYTSLVYEGPGIVRHLADSMLP